MDQISILILTHNEEANIAKCITSARAVSENIFLVDSGSTDRTVEIAKGLGATVLAHPWTTHAEQFNWGLDSIPFETGWIMRLDADEEVTPGLAAALKETLPGLPPEVAGILVRRQVHFMGRWIRHGGYYPTWLLRVFRRGRGRCEALWMDEHIVLDGGRAIRIPEDIIDRNAKDLTFWTEKHNGYASREVMDLLAAEGAEPGAEGPRAQAAVADSQTRARRWMKTNVYARAPLFLRAFLYFLYRYILRAGFLDGREGLIFHFLQGFWYRFLVDAKLFEERRRRRARCAGDGPGRGKDESR